MLVLNTPDKTKILTLETSRPFPVVVATPSDAINLPYALANIAALRAAPIPGAADVVRGVLGYYAAGDASLPNYRWAPTSTAADNGGTVIRPTAIIAANPGRWLAIASGPYRAEWFGCKGDNGITDNGLLIQRAIDAAIAAEVGQLFFSPGRFYYTTAISIPAGKQLSLLGQGSNKTIFYPVNQHGLTINNNDTEGIVSVISGIHIQCSGQNYCGIYAPGTQQSFGDSARLYGYVIENCTFTNCGIGLYFGYGSKIVIQNNDLINCYYGVVFRGQCVGCVARSNRITLGASPGSPPVSLVPILDPGGGTQAIWVGGRNYTAGYLRGEDVQVRENWTFGYSIGCTIFDCLYTVVDGNDLDFCTALGIFFNSTDGGIRIINNWIGMDSRVAAIQAGISSNTAGGVNVNLATIRDNHIAIVGTVAGGVGIRILYNAYEGTIVEGNTIDCEVLQYGIFFDRVNDGQITRNRLYGTINSGEDYIVCSQCGRTKIFDNQTPNRFPFLGSCTGTIGRYLVPGIGIVDQNGPRFTFWDGSALRERIGTNDGDINTLPSNYKYVGGNLPSSPTGLPAGSYWVDAAAGGAIKRV
jgi:parallel beta-helix repeat protein